MNLLLDTHLLIWALNDDPKLPQAARDLILDPDNTIYYSAASILEVSIKHSNHPDNVPFNGKTLSQYCREAGFLPLEIREKHVLALETLTRPDTAPPHRDPFDRILLAQAKNENLSFLTHDELIPYYKEPCILSA